jgi:hypothetical protein
MVSLQFSAIAVIHLKATESARTRTERDSADLPICTFDSTQRAEPAGKLESPGRLMSRMVFRPALHRTNGHFPLARVILRSTTKSGSLPETAQRDRLWNISGNENCTLLTKHDE